MIEYYRLQKHTCAVTDIKTKARNSHVIHNDFIMALTNILPKIEELMRLSQG